MHPRKLFLIISTTIIVVFIAIFLSLNGNLVGADTANGNAKDLSLEFSLPEGTITLIQQKQGEKPNFKIIRRYWLFQRALTLTGFEEEANLCADHQIDFAHDAKTICLIGEVGVHSMNLQIIQLTATGLKAASFTPAIEAKSNNITSDLPFFSFQDIDNDSIIDLVVYNRDYDSDPLKYAFKSYYLGDENGNYHFDSKEKIAYNVNDN